MPQSAAADACCCREPDAVKHAVAAVADASSAADSSAAVDFSAAAGSSAAAYSAAAVDACCCRAFAAVKGCSCTRCRRFCCHRCLCCCRHLCGCKLRCCSRCLCCKARCFDKLAAAKLSCSRSHAAVKAFAGVKACSLHEAYLMHHFRTAVHSVLDVGEPNSSLGAALLAEQHTNLQCASESLQQLGAAISHCSSNFLPAAHPRNIGAYAANTRCGIFSAVHPLQQSSSAAYFHCSTLLQYMQRTFAAA